MVTQKLVFNLSPIGDAVEMEKMNKRLVKVNKGHTDECKQLLTLMGLPYVEVGWPFLH
jgi:flap endonuclease-1